MPEKKKMFWRYNWPAFVWALFVLLLCGIPGDRLPELTFLEWLKPDKIAHLILFGMQCFLLLKGFTRQNIFLFLNNHPVSLSLIISISYGCLIEVLQEYVFVHRSGDVRDAVANAIGAFIGLWLFNRYVRKSVSC